MGKPAALPGDSKSLTFPGGYRSFPLLNRSKLKKGETSDGRIPKLKSHSRGKQVSRCVDSQVPQKVPYGDLRKHLGNIVRELAVQKESSILEGHLILDHIHVPISIRPKFSVAQVVGFIKDKIAIQIARTFSGR